MVTHPKTKALKNGSGYNMLAGRMWYRKEIVRNEVLPEGTTGFCISKYV